MKKKSYGGITKKYAHEFDELIVGLCELVAAGGVAVGPWMRGDTDRAGTLSDWLNGPCTIAQRLERVLADVESKIKDDPQFSKQNKQACLSEVTDKLKSALLQFHKMDSVVMNGTIPPT